MTNFLEAGTGDNAGSADQSTDTENSVSTAVEENTENSEISGDQDSEVEKDGDSDQGDDVESKEETQKTKPKNGFKKRIDRLNRNLSIKEQRIAQLEAELAGRANTKASTQEPAIESDQEPNMDDFKTVGEYNRALVKWEMKQARLAQQKAESEASAKTYEQKLNTEYTKREAEFVKSTPGFEDALEAFQEQHGQFRASPRILEAIKSSEFGPHLFYDVISTPGEYERLSGMSETAIIRELGRKEAKFAAAAATKKEIKTSKAPAPVAPVSKGGGTPIAKSLSDPNLPFSDYERLRTQMLKNKK